MALTDGDVAALARQAVDLLDPELEIAIQPEDQADPYRWDRAHGWTVRVHVGGRLVAVRVESTWTPEQALARLCDELRVPVPEGNGPTPAAEPDGSG